MLPLLQRLIMGPPAKKVRVRTEVVRRPFTPVKDAKVKRAKTRGAKTRAAKAKEAKAKGDKAKK